MRIAVEEILLLRKRLNDINDMPFENIEWYENGQLLIINSEISREWKFVGLCNDSFITTGEYKE